MEQEKKFSLSQIYFYLTEGCNLRCQHCWLAPKHQHQGKVYGMLALRQFRNILEQGKLLGLSSVKLTGGEPLLHPEIFEIFKIIRDFDLRLSVETNGTLCTPKHAKEIAQTKERPFVAVSLDGANAEVYEKIRGVKGSFQKAINGIRSLVDAGIFLQLILTVMQSNKEQIEEVIRFAEVVGAKSVKLNIVQPTARGEDLYKKRETLTIQELLELDRWLQEKIVPKTKIRVFFDQPMAFRPLGKMFDPEGGCGGSCGVLNILGVLHNGNYALCGIGTHIEELVFGHVDKDPLEKVWNENEVLNDLRTGLPSKLSGVCAHCLMKHFCRGSCIAQNYYRTKSLWSGFWYCEEAFRLGLFPKSRLVPQAGIRDEIL